MRGLPARLLSLSLSLIALAILAGWVGMARADELLPAIIYGPSGPFDKGFNQAALDGTLSFRAQSGLSTRGYDTGDRRSSETALEAAIADGANFIIALGAYSASAVDQAAQRHPDRRFLLIDEALDRPNVQSVLFNDAEGGMLAGMAAALATKSRTVAFLGGMDLPVIRRFETGFRHGVAQIDPAIAVLSRMTGTTPAAFDDPFTGYRLGLDMLKQGGADVIFAAAGTTGLGALQAANDTQTRAIGVDTDQNDLFPGTMLASVLKRVDLAVQEALTQVWRGDWRPGLRRIGLAEGGLSLQLSPNAQAILGPDGMAKLNDLIAGIASGAITIPVQE